MKKYKEKIIIATLLLSLVVVIFSFNHFTSHPITFVYLEKYQYLIAKLFSLSMIVLSVLLLKAIISLQIINKIKDPTPRFYAHKVVNFFAWLIVIIMGLSLLFKSWTASIASLGVISIIIGITLQSSVSNFFAWIILLVSPVYRVGDRVKVDNATGDVIAVGYFYTTLWEFGGDYVSNDLPSGRIIILPNSKIFTSNIYNYSWPLFPYIWSEVSFNVSYYADFDFIESTCQSIASSHLGASMKEHVVKYRKTLSTTPVDDIEVQDEPRIFFTSNGNNSIKVSVRFLSDPKQLSDLKKDLLLEMIQTLRLSPEKVKFPMA